MKGLYGQEEGVKRGTILESLSCDQICSCTDKVCSYFIRMHGSLTPHTQNTALLIVGHGSTENAESSTPYFDHADEIRERGVFKEVHCCFWKEEPSMREAYYNIEADVIFVVPDFISEGYFTREVIPRELELDGPTTTKFGKTIHYCDPVGIHPGMSDILSQRSREVAPGFKPEDTTIFIIGHGTGLNAQSAEAIRTQVKALAERHPEYASVQEAYMEEEPLIEKWDSLAKTSHVVAVPFFIADGLHSYEDIPVLLGMREEGDVAEKGEVFAGNPYTLRGKTLAYSPAIGTDKNMAQVILDQVNKFIDTQLAE